MSWKVHGTDDVFAALRGLCSNSYRMYDPSEYRSYYDHDCETYECAVEDAAREYERLLRHCNHQREQLKAWGNAPTLRKIMEDGMGSIEGSSKVRAGSSITEELRMYVQDWRDTPSLMDGLDRGDVDGILEDFVRIADRIDAEHAEAVADALQLRGEPDRWVELPVDADGVPIHVWDVMEWPDGSTFDVVGISANTLFYVEHDFDDSAQWTAAHDKRHHQPDSWERIIADAVKLGYADYPTTSYEAELVERCRRVARQEQ